jgi:hypothetical protein
VPEVEGLLRRRIEADDVVSHILAAQ